METRSKKLGEIGEKRIINEVLSKYISKPSFGEYLYFPEDVRDILPKAPRIYFSIDGYSINSVKLPWRNLSDIGWCAVTGAVSDHVCKGGFPKEIVISLGLPPDYTLDDLENIMSGVNDAVNTYGLKLVGGDLNKSIDPWINVAVLSYTSVKKPPGRCCGKPGDLVIVTGIYGAMGYVSIHGLEESTRVKWVVENTRRPRVYLETAVVIASSYRFIHASMDTSDSLGNTLLEIVRLSGRGILLEKPPKFHSELREICSSEECIWKYVLSGGEEYGTVIIVSEKHVSRVIDYLDKLHIPYEVIGRVVDKPPHLFLGDTIIDNVFKQWDQFLEWSI